MAFKGSKNTEKRKPHQMVVKRAFQYKNNNVAFDLEVDGWIIIYNMTLVATYSDEDKEKMKKAKKVDYDKFEPEKYFISFPQHKDDAGNWWSYAYFNILEEEQDVIEDQIQHILDESEEEK